MQDCSIGWRWKMEKPYVDGGEVERRGTASLLEEADWSLCRDGTSATRVKYDDRYAGALPFRAR